MPRPMAHMTFSFKSGNSVAPSRSNTTSRSEFDPTSTTAMRPGGAAARVRLGIGNQRQRATSLGLRRFSAAVPRPDRLGLVMK